jgi:hypothetical protein
MPSRAGNRADFQGRCRKGAKFAAHAAFSAILGEISCLLSGVENSNAKEIRGGSLLFPAPRTSSRRLGHDVCLFP